MRILEPHFCKCHPLAATGKSYTCCRHHGVMLDQQMFVHGCAVNGMCKFSFWTFAGLHTYLKEAAWSTSSVTSSPDYFPVNVLWMFQPVLMLWSALTRSSVTTPVAMFIRHVFQVDDKGCSAAENGWTLQIIMAIFADCLYARCIRTAKEEFYHSEFDKYKNDVRKTWDTLKRL